MALALMGLCFETGSLTETGYGFGFLNLQFINVMQRKGIENTTILNRLGTTNDMAAATAFLASDDASYITGETLVVAGGIPSRL